jgi:hypothetical protein
MKCPGCGRWFDMRDLGKVAEHIHDGSEIDCRTDQSPITKGGRQLRRPKWGVMKELSKRDWLFVTLSAFVMSGTLFVVLYWLYQMGW